MKLSIFSTETRPKARGDAWMEARNCYRDLADERVVVDGSIIPDKSFSEYMKIVHKEWPKGFDWPFIGEQFTRGYEACTGDVVIHADIDFIFHQNDFEAIREACEEMLNSDAPAIAFVKHQFILPDRYNLKSRLVVAVNKAMYGDRIKFDSGRDLCQPSLDGRYLEPDKVRVSRIPIYNYEKLIKTEAQIKNDVGRMARAWQRHFGEYKLGGPDDESAYQKWLQMTEGRFRKDQKRIKLEDHPQYVQETIRNLKPDQWGYSGFNKLGVNDYV